MSAPAGKQAGPAAPQDVYNAELIRYRRLYYLFLLRSEVAWQKRMREFADEVQGILSDHAGEDGQLTRREELRRRIHMASQALARDLDLHLRRNIRAAALLGAKSTADAGRVYLAVAGGEPANAS